MKSITWLFRKVKGFVKTIKWFMLLGFSVADAHSLAQKILITLATTALAWNYKAITHRILHTFKIKFHKIKTLADIKDHQLDVYIAIQHLLSIYRLKKAPNAFYETLQKDDVKYPDFHSKVIATLKELKKHHPEIYLTTHDKWSTWISTLTTSLLIVLSMLKIAPLILSFFAISSVFIGALLAGILVLLTCFALYENYQHHNKQQTFNVLCRKLNAWIDFCKEKPRLSTTRVPFFSLLKRKCTQLTISFKNVKLKTVIKSSIFFVFPLISYYFLPHITKKFFKKMPYICAVFFSEKNATMRFIWVLTLSIATFFIITPYLSALLALTTTPILRLLIHTIMASILFARFYTLIYNQPDFWRFKEIVKPFVCLQQDLKEEDLLTTNIGNMQIVYQAILAKELPNTTLQNNSL